MSYIRNLLILIAIAVNMDVTWAGAQNLSADSTMILSYNIRRQTNDTLKVRSLIHLGNYIMKRPGENRSQIDSGMKYLDQGIALARQLHATKLEMLGYLTAGVNLFENKDSTTAKTYYRSASDYYMRSGSLKEKAVFFLNYGNALYANTQNYSESLKFTLKADSLYRSLRMTESALAAENMMAELYSKTGNTDAAIDLFLKVASAWKTAGNIQGLGATQRGLAALYWKKGNVQQTLYYNIEALKSAQKVNNEQDIFLSNSDLASLYYNLKMFDKALFYMEGAYRYELKKRDQGSFHTILLSIVHIRIKLGMTNGLLEFIKHGEKEIPPTAESRQASVFQAYGLAYAAAGNEVLAEQNFLKSMTLFDAAQRKHQYGAILNVFTRSFNRAIGDFYIKNKKFRQARPYFETVLRLPKNVITPNTEIEARSAMFKIDSAGGDYISAIRNFQTKTLLHDSLFNASAVRQVAELNAKYETEQHLKNIKLLKSQRDAQQLLSQKVTLQRNITFGGIAALLTIAGLLFAGYRNKKNINRRLQFQQAKINQQNYSLQSLLSDKEVLLTEKDWLLKEVHHRVKNNLQIIMSLLNSQSVYTDDPKALEAIKISRDRVQAISLIHQKLSNENNQATVNIKTYVAELVNYLSDGFDTVKKNITFKQSIAAVDIDIAQAVSIALILNEAITNSIKYAFDETGGQILLDLKIYDEGMIELKINDNGIGVDRIPDLQNISSLGFSIMKGLSAQLKGDFTINNQSGFCVTLKFPIKKIKTLQA